MPKKTLDDFSEQIDRSHESDEEEKRPLHEFLGLTWDEYKLLVGKGSI